MKLAAVLVLALSLSLPLAAQESVPEIAYNQVVTGIITDESDTHTYRFQGKNGDAIVATLREAQPFNGFDEPQITIRDPDGAVIATTHESETDFAVFNRGAYLAVVLPTDGQYTVDAGRSGGMSGASRGEYRLELRLPPQLQPNRPIRDSVFNDSDFDFFVYHAASDFDIRYTKRDGDYWPHIRVNIIDVEKNALLAVGHLGGDRLSRGLLGTFAAGRTYFISVGEPAVQVTNMLFFHEVFADYEIELILPEAP